MTCKPIIAVAVALALTGCATARYHAPDRTPAAPAGAVDLPTFPDAQLVVCPRGHWDPAAICPWGSEWVAYDAKNAAVLEQFAIAAQANTHIADLQVDEIRALDAEAAARNDTAGQLEAEIAAEKRGRLLERLGWIGSLALILGAAL